MPSRPNGTKDFIATVMAEYKRFVSIIHEAVHAAGGCKVVAYKFTTNLRFGPNVDHKESKKQVKNKALHC